LPRTCTIRDDSYTSAHNATPSSSSKPGSLMTLESLGGAILLVILVIILTKGNF
jgi:hypothetical protein